MNVLSDILCDNTSPLMMSQSYQVPFQQNQVPSQHDISTQRSSLHLLDTVSQIASLERPMSSGSHSSPTEINVFNTSSQIHIPSNIDSGFEDQSNVSVFSDSFAEIVPSWLTHDFMKASDSLSSPVILPNVSDIYSTSTENEQLEMLELGFSSELTSHNASSNLNHSCTDNKKVLADLPMQSFSNNSLMIPSFDDMNDEQLDISMNKNVIQYQKYQQNEPLINPINSFLPCNDNKLLHLPLPSNLSEQCLNSSSPSMISNSQSQTHPINVCDKLPQLNLNHLDSTLGNKSNMPEIQLIHHDFHFSENSSNNNSSHDCLNTYNPSENLISNNVLVSSNISQSPITQDASVQVSLDIDVPSPISHCFSCSEVPYESPIETTQCFKCKFCDYISIHKCAVSSHITASHSKSNVSVATNDSKVVSLRSDEFNPVSIENQNESHFITKQTQLNESTNTASINTNPIVMVSAPNVIEVNNYNCIQCNIVFPDLADYNSHLISNHAKSNQTVQLSLVDSGLISYQLIPINSVILTAPSNEPPKQNDLLMNGEAGNQNGNAKFKSSVRCIAKKPENTESQRKVGSKKSTSEASSANNEKNISVHKKAWQKKMTRELGAYICEFKGCNFRFRAPDNLDYHRRCHVAEKGFACPECGQHFDNWGTIAGHLWRTHGNDMELHACDQCPFKTFSLSRMENLHKKIHNEECSFLCDTCGKGFKNIKQMRNHRVIHFKPKEKKTFKCNVCSIVCSSNSLLSKHKANIHSKGYKRYDCNYCDYSAVKKCTLDLHIRKHTGEKPYKCDKCDFCTADHNSLRNHKMKHSGEKCYKCPYCAYSGKQAQAFKEHLRKRHPNETANCVFHCNLCKFRTIKQDAYMVHMSEHVTQNEISLESQENRSHSNADLGYFRLQVQSYKEQLAKQNSGQDLSLMFSCNLCKFRSTDDEKFVLHMYEHEGQNGYAVGNLGNELHNEMLPLAEAMDISLSHSDNLLSNFNKHKNIESFFNNFNAGLMAVSQGEVN